MQKNLLRIFPAQFSPIIRTPFSSTSGRSITRLLPPFRQNTSRTQCLTKTARLQTAPAFPLRPKRKWPKAHCAIPKKSMAITLCAITSCAMTGALTRSMLPNSFMSTLNRLRQPPAQKRFRFTESASAACSFSHTLENTALTESSLSFLIQPLATAASFTATSLPARWKLMSRPLTAITPTRPTRQTAQVRRYLKIWTNSSESSSAQPLT